MGIQIKLDKKYLIMLTMTQISLPKLCLTSHFQLSTTVPVSNLVNTVSVPTTDVIEFKHVANPE